MVSTFVILGVVFKHHGWHAILRTRAHNVRMVLDAAFVFASQVLHSNCVATVSVCRGVSSMFAINTYVYGVGIAWCRGGDASSVTNVVFRCMVCQHRPPAQSMVQEFAEVGVGQSWSEVCFIKCLCVRPFRRPAIVSVAPYVPMFVGAVVRHLRVKAQGPVEEDALRATHGG